MPCLYLDVTAPCGIPVDTCTNVKLCLISGWENKTVDGTRIIAGRIINQTVKKTAIAKKGAGCCIQPTTYKESSCDCVYQVEIDLAQIKSNPLNNVTYSLLDSDVCEVVPYSCIVDAIVEQLDDNTQDWTIDQDNVSILDIPTEKTFTITIPIHDRISLESKGSVVLDLSNLYDNQFSTMSLNIPASVATFVAGGSSLNINFCDMISGCMDGTTIVRQTNGKYKATIPIVSSLANNLISADTNGRAFLECADIVACVPAIENSDLIEFPTTYSSGARQVRHTDLDGNAQVFAEGFTSVKSDNTCSAGVGASKAVRSVSISSGQLIVDAAYEHTTGAQSTALATGVGQEISTLGVTRDHGPTPPLVINNANPCRAIRYIYVANFSTQVTCQVGGVWKHNGYIGINGSSPPPTAEAQYGTYPGLVGTAWTMTASAHGEIAPGANLSLTAAQQVVSLVGSPAGSSFVSGAIGVSLIGGTV